MGKKLIIAGADFSQVAVASNTVPVTGLTINGASGSKTQRQVQLSVSYIPVDTTQRGVIWSVVSGDATITNDGLLTYNGHAGSATVLVMATSKKNSTVFVQASVSFAIPAVEAPIFSPAQGTYNQTQNVAINCATSGAVIYYTTDGSTPTTSSSVYSSPITVNANMTIKAIAVKNGENSEVAIASYIIEIPHTVTVNVSDGTDPVSGATVLLKKNGVDYSPSANVGGSYVFYVPDGTYTLSVAKQGFANHTEQVVVNGQDVVVVVVVKRNLLEKAIIAHANCMGSQHAPLYAVVTSSGSNIGAYIQAFTGQNRCSVILPRSEASNPNAWKGWNNYQSDIAAQSFASLLEWPADVEEIEIRLTNPNYFFDSGVCDSYGNNAANENSGWKQGGPNVVQTYKRSDYPLATHMGVWFKYQENSNWNNNATIESMGLSVMEK